MRLMLLSFLAALPLAASVFAQPGVTPGGVNISATVVDATAGAPFILESLSVGAYTATAADLMTGSIIAKSNSPNFLGTWNPPYTTLNPASDFDLNTLLAKSDPDDVGQFPSATAKPIDVFFGGNVGVVSNWKDTNGANPDFFIYEVVPDANTASGGFVGGDGDRVDLAAIMPDGSIGLPVFTQNAGNWGETTLLKSGNPNGGQEIVGISLSITDFLDPSGAALTTSSQIKGIRIYSNTLDPAFIGADVAQQALPLEVVVNTTTGAVSLHNPNATEYSLGFNYYRLHSASGSLRTTNWNSLDDQDAGADPAGTNWVEGGGSFSGAPSVGGDFNSDGVVSTADYTTWRDGLGATYTAADYDTWRANFGLTAPPAGATTQLLELNNDGLKTLAPGASVSLGNVFAIGGTNDITLTYGVASGYLATGTVSASGSLLTGAGAVPEPSSIALVLLGAVAVWGRRVARATALLVAFVFVGHAATTQAALIASEDFESYAAGTLTGGNGGTGWAAAWTAPPAGTIANVIDTSASSLSHAVAGGGLVDGADRAVQVTRTTGNNPAGARQLSASIQQTFYASFLVRYTNTAAGSFGADNTFSLHFSDSASNVNTFNVGMRASASLTQASNTQHFMVRNTTAATSVALATQATGGLVQTGTDYFVVARMNYSGTNFDSIDAWLNPAYTDNLGTPDMTFSIAANTGLAGISHVFFRQAANQNDDVFNADQLLIGSTWQDVVPGAQVPEPATASVLALGVVLAGAVGLRRRLMQVLGLLAALLCAPLVAQAEVVFSLNPAATTDLTSVLSSGFGTVVGPGPAGFEAVVPTVQSTGTQVQLTHTGASTYTGTQVEMWANWGIGSGTTPTDFAPLLGDLWRVTWTANNSATTATDRMNLYIDDADIMGALEGYELGYMVAAGAAEANAQGVRLRVDGTSTAMKAEDLVTNLNGSVSRSYRLVVDEVLGTYTAYIDNGTGFYLVGSGSTSFASAEREFYFQIRDRNITGTAPNIINEIGTISAMVIENVPPGPSLVVDRATGNVTMENLFATGVQVVSYAITSAEGGLVTDPTGWDPIAGRLDQAGDDSFDPDSNWTVSSNTALQLAEAANSGNGGLLAPAATVSLGNAWAKTPIDDLAFSFTLDGGSVAQGNVRYINEILEGDFDRDGTLDRDDFIILTQNSFASLAGETGVGAYYKGDIDVDGDNDYNDFAAFRLAYIDANGAAAFAALTGSAVPEPSSLLIVGGSLAAVWFLRRS